MKRSMMAGLAAVMLFSSACGTADADADGIAAPGASDTAATDEGGAEGVVVPSPDDAPPDGTAGTTVPGSLVTVPPQPDKSSGSAPPPGDEPEPGVIDPLLGSFVESAVADLAARLSVDQGAITIVRAEAVVWPDGSIGCPMPGMAYTQVMVEGSLIELWTDGVSYRYHSGGNRGQFLCENPAEPVVGGSGGAAGDI